MKEISPRDVKIWIGTTLIQIVAQLYFFRFNDMFYTDGPFEVLFSLVIAAIIAAPLLFKGAWRETVFVACILSLVWVFGSLWFASKAPYSPNMLDLGIILFMLMYSSSIMLIYFIYKHAIPLQYKWLSVFLGFIPAIMMYSMYYVGLGMVLVIFPLGVIPLIAALVMAGKFFKHRWFA